MSKRFAILLACAVAAACSGSPAPEGALAGAEAAGTAPAAPAVPDDEARVRAALGGGARLADRSPNLLRADFNGDGVIDVLAVVLLRGEAPRQVRVVEPWPLYHGAEPAEPGGEEVALAVIHGGPSGGAFLLRDPNPISVLDAGAAHHLSVIPAAEVEAADGEVSRQARGDVLVVPTEAGIDTFLFWDGATYRHHAPLEMP